MSRVLGRWGGEAHILCAKHPCATSQYFTEIPDGATDRDQSIWCLVLKSLLCQD